MFTHPAILATNIATLLVGFPMFGAFVLVPQIAETPKMSGYSFGLGAPGAALLLVRGSVMMLAFGPLSGKLGARPRPGSRSSRARWCPQQASGCSPRAMAQREPHWVLSRGLRRHRPRLRGHAHLIVGAIPRTETGEATGVHGLIRSLGSSVGSQIAATLLAAGVSAARRCPPAARSPDLRHRRLSGHGHGHRRLLHPARQRRATAGSAAPPERPAAVLAAEPARPRA